MDLVVEHLLVEVHRCLSSFFPTRFSGWPTSSSAGMMPPYGAQGELRRTPLLRMAKNSDGQRPRPAYYYRALESPTKGLLRCPTTPIAQGALGRCATSTPTP